MNNKKTIDNQLFNFSYKLGELVKIYYFCTPFSENWIFKRN